MMDKADKLWLEHMMYLSREALKTYQLDKKDLNDVYDVLGELEDRVKDKPVSFYRYALGIAQDMVRRILSMDVSVRNEDDLDILFSIKPDPILFSQFVIDGINIKAKSLEVDLFNKAIELGCVSPWINSSSKDFSRTPLMTKWDSDRLFVSLENLISSRDYVEISTGSIDKEAPLDQIVLCFLQSHLAHFPEDTIKWVMESSSLDEVHSTLRKIDYADFDENITNREKLLLDLLIKDHSSNVLSALKSVAPDAYENLSRSESLKKELKNSIAFNHVDIRKISAGDFLNKEDLVETLMIAMTRAPFTAREYRRIEKSYKALGGSSLINDAEIKPSDDMKDLMEMYTEFKNKIASLDSFSQIPEISRMYERNISSYIAVDHVRNKGKPFITDDLEDRLHAFIIGHHAGLGRTDILREVNTPIAARMWLEVAQSGKGLSSGYANVEITPVLTAALKGLSREEFNKMVNRGQDIPCLRKVNWDDNTIKKDIISNDLGL